MKISPVLVSCRTESAAALEKTFCKFFCSVVATAASVSHFCSGHLKIFEYYIIHYLLGMLREYLSGVSYESLEMMCCTGSVGFF